MAISMLPLLLISPAFYSADKEAPTVSITAPAPGANVSFGVNITADASDNVGVVGVRFKVDGMNIGNEDTTSPYGLLWDSTTVSNGSHVLSAVARDASGKQTLSTGISITTNNPTPTATITSTATVSPTPTPIFTTTPTFTPTATSLVPLSQGKIKVIGSQANRGAINPDQGESAKIYFQADQVGMIECWIFTLTGQLVWNEKLNDYLEGYFEWPAAGMASGIYIVLVKGPGLNAKQKIAVLR